jgi:ribosomal protein S17
MDVDKFVDETLDTLSEQFKAKRTTITKVTRQTKIDRTIGALATKYAKEKNDPLYHKMQKFRKKFFHFREKIRAKYGPRVRSRAIQGKGISDLLKKDKESEK